MLTCKEIITFFKLEYDLGAYYLGNFQKVKSGFLKKIAKNKSHCSVLTRIITGYSMTK